MDESRARPFSRAAGTTPSDAVFSSRRVAFLGPPLSRQIRESLSAAQITMIDRRRAVGWDGQIQAYIVSVDARDDEDAVRRVRVVLGGKGSFAAFTSEERS